MESIVCFAVALVFFIVFVLNLFWGRVYDFPMYFSDIRQYKWFAYKKYEPRNFWIGVFFYTFIILLFVILGILLKFGLIYLR